jgi:hypothetical protein
MPFYRHYVLYDKLEITQEYNGNLHRYVCDLPPTENFKPFKNHNAYLEFLDRCLKTEDNAYCYIAVGGKGLLYMEISFWYENDLLVVEHDLSLLLVTKDNKTKCGFECVADYKIEQNVIVEHDYIEISAYNAKTNQSYFDNFTLEDIQKQNKNWNVEIATKFIAECLEKTRDECVVRVWKNGSEAINTLRGGADSLTIHFVIEQEVGGNHLSVSLRQIS